MKPLFIPNCNYDSYYAIALSDIALEYVKRNIEGWAKKHTPPMGVYSRYSIKMGVDVKRKMWQHGEESIGYFSGNSSSRYVMGYSTENCIVFDCYKNLQMYVEKKLDVLNRWHDRCRRLALKKAAEILVSDGKSIVRIYAEEMIIYYESPEKEGDSYWDTEDLRREIMALNGGIEVSAFAVEEAADYVGLYSKESAAKMPPMLLYSQVVTVKNFNNLVLRRLHSTVQEAAAEVYKYILNPQYYY